MEKLFSSPLKSQYAPYFGQKAVYAAYKEKSRVVKTDSLSVYAAYWHIFFLWAILLLIAAQKRSISFSKLHK
jgi:hypothetical protein